MTSLAGLRIVLGMALRNLLVHRIKSLVVGALMFFGAFLVVFASAMLDSVQASMERSITSSLAGNAQVYAADAKDPLALFPAGSGGSVDYGEIDDFPKVRDALMSVDNVKDVVPMGITTAIVFGTPEIDHVLAELRRAVDEGDADSVALFSDHARAIAAALHTDVEKSLAMASDPAKVRSDLAALDEVSSEAFWQGLEADPAGVLAFLDTRVAPLAMDGRLLYFRIIGTDLAQFSRTFGSFQVVDGALPPPGEPGLMLAKRVYEKQIKNKVARDLDNLKEGRDAGSTLADDAVLGLTARRLPQQVQVVLFELAPSDAAVVADRLSAELGTDGDVRSLLQTLLTVDDANFDERYALFYDVVAPRIRLYDAPVGSEIVLRGLTKTGYMRAANVKVYGTFNFAGLEGSDLAGANNLVDLGTLRTLYGRMTASQQAELADIKATVGAIDVSRDQAEDALFGGGPVESVAPAAPVSSAPASNEKLALNAAVIFEDPSRTAETILALQAKSDAEGLGLQVVDWMAASGIVGQLLMVLRAILTIAIGVIFVVALVIINNTLVMATMERTTEIGTMRAIGAPRSWVLVLFVVETVALGLIAGGLGAAAGAGLVIWLGSVGVPAVADILVLLFAGKHLYPSVSAGNVAFGMTAIVVISLLSTLYPAWLATRVQPVVAMSGKE